MANHSSSKKAIRKTVRQTTVNKNRISRIRTFIKKVEASMASNDKDSAKKDFITAQSEIMRGVSSNVIKKTTASRKISRLSKRLKAICLGTSQDMI